ncbi:MAG TPA: LytTR family DNA-binding domain-containing protein [Thermoanaerobaculia bacterium]|nr:LytTR family DNA-binding domain-containing protein [Thermoanaerobaculia bacterium]
MSERLRALIADDEPLARAQLAALLAAHPVIEIVGQAGDGAETLARIASLRPDLVFLDITMPAADAFDLLGELESEARPMIIFTTASEEHALRAFGAEAIDYLLKPIEPARLAEAIRKAERFARGLRTPDPARYRSRIAAKAGERTVLVAAEDIDWIEPVGNYAKLRVGTHAYYVRATMQALEAELDPARFVRIHRSAIVNVDRIAEVARGVSAKEYVVVLRTGERLDMQRTFAGRLRALVGRF